MHAIAVGLRTRWNRQTPLVLQSEAAECGLACVAMLAGHHGHDVDLTSLRARHGHSLRGARLEDLMHSATSLGLHARALRAEPNALASLSLPAILHVDFNHFVVLTTVRKNRFVIHDPAQGERYWSATEVSERFTGVVLEAVPGNGFRVEKIRQRIGLRTLTGPVPGLLRGVVQVLAFAIALEAFTLVAPFYLQWVVDDVLVSADRNLLFVLMAGFGLLAIFRVVVNALRSWIMLVLGVHLSLAMSRRLFAHLIRLPMPWFIARSLGDVNSRFESLDAVQDTLTNGAMAAIVDGILSVALLVMMYAFSPLLCAVVTATSVLYALLRLAMFRPLRLGTEEQIVCRSKRDSHFLESLRGMQSVKLFGAEVMRCEKYQNLLVSESNAGIRVQRLNIVYAALNGTLFGIENILVVGLAAQQILDGVFTAGMLLAFIAYKQQFVARISTLIETLVTFRMLDLHRERIGDIALCEPEQHSTSGASLQPRTTDIVIDRVSFRHAEHEPDVLENVSLQVCAGESVAIVGPSGCGKTTLMKLILGLLAPSTGEIRIGGVNTARIDQQWRQTRIAAVMQDDQLFSGSLYDNIAFFDPEVDYARVEHCACLAAVDREIESLPMGYHTLVGDMGNVLSGGQKQRVLLARALYRRPKILLLDEATSHLDVARECKVNMAISELEITRLIIAHRPETIASADRVVMLGCEIDIVL